MGTPWEIIRSHMNIKEKPWETRKAVENYQKQWENHRTTIENHMKTKERNNQQWRFPWDLELIFDSQVDEIFQ